MNQFNHRVKTVAEAKKIQEKLRNQVITQDCFGQVHYVAGTDVGFKDNYSITQAAVGKLILCPIET